MSAIGSCAIPARAAWPACVDRARKVHDETTRLVCLLLLGVSSGLGCDQSPELTPTATLPGYPRAYAMRDCAPWDGPAIAIVLTTHAVDSPETAYPFVRAVIYPRDESMSGHTYRWPGEPEMAAGSRCTSADSCEAAVTGKITMSAVRPDTTLEGRVVLRFAGGDEISGGFRAVWLTRRVMCG